MQELTGLAKNTVGIQILRLGEIHACSCCIYRLIINRLYDVPRLKNSR